eukprot:2815850-Amphidinium_carterae.1
MTFFPVRAAWLKRLPMQPRRAFTPSKQLGQTPILGTLSPHKRLSGRKLQGLAVTSNSLDYVRWMRALLFKQLSGKQGHPTSMTWH